MRVLVTGGSGFIGRYFCERLLAAGHEVIILDLVAPSWPHEGICVELGDVRDASAVRKALDGCDLVVHLAAAHHDFGISEATYFGVNEGGARVLTEEMDRTGVRRACFFSSVAVYGDAPEPRTETTAPAPANPYGASKLAGEAVFRRWTERGDGRRALVIRPAVVFGPRNFANVYALMRQIHSGLYLPVGRGVNVKSMAYVENVVDAALHLLALPGLPAFDAYNYVDLPHLTSRGIGDAIAEALGRRAAPVSVPLPLALALAAPFDAVIRLPGRNLLISSARVRKLATMQTKFEAAKVREAGFEPAHTLRDGIRRMADWFLAEGRHLPVVSHLPPETVGAAPVAAAKAAGA
jgi:nucleoside-diphosphate-sugar epimerase